MEGLFFRTHGLGTALGLSGLAPNIAVIISNVPRAYYLTAINRTSTIMYDSKRPFSLYSNNMSQSFVVYTIDERFGTRALRADFPELRGLHGCLANQQLRCARRTQRDQNQAWYRTWTNWTDHATVEANDGTLE